MILSQPHLKFTLKTMQVGICISNDDILNKISTLDKYTDYFETNPLSDELIETVQDYLDRIKVVHLPDLDKNCVESLRQASKLEIEKAVVHFFTVNTLKRESKMEILEAISTVAEESGITLCLENTEEPPSEMLKIIIDVPDLSFCLDIGHGNLFNNNPSDFLDRLHGHLAHVHIHDNFGGVGEEFDRHLVPREGGIDFGEVLRGLGVSGYDDTFTLELTPYDGLDRKINAIEQTRDLIHQYLK